MTDTKVAVVTGSNKGIGLGTVKRLCKDFPGDVILTARDEERGLAAVEKLRKEGLSPKFHQLDIESKQSVDTIKQFLSKQYGGLDVLVNNAGIAYPENTPAPFIEQVERSIAINYYGIVNVLEALCPILRPHARVVNVGTRGANLGLTKCSDAVQKRAMSCETVEQVTAFMADYVRLAKLGKLEEEGFSPFAYGMSKVGGVLITPIYQNLMDKDQRKDIVVNCCCPGLVKTDLSENKGGKSVNEGADMPIYLSLLPPNVKSPRGEFVAEGDILHVNTPIDMAAVLKATGGDVDGRFAKLV